MSEMVTHVPRGPLSEVVACIWHCRAPAAAGRELVLPSGLAQLLINVDARPLHAGGSRAVVQGPCSRAATIERSDRRDLVGVVLQPGALGALSGVAAAELADRALALDLLPQRALLGRLEAEIAPGRSSQDLIAAAAAALRPRALEAAPSAQVARALRCIERGSLRVDTLSSSPRRLREAFRREVGLSPKALICVRRFQRALVALRRGTRLSELALDCGYCDQAHLDREFRKFAGLSPTAYLARQGDERNHVPLPA